jgi:hypothetical protein
LRTSTSSKYSREPTGFCECRMLQGRASQYRRTSVIDLFGELLTIVPPGWNSLPVETVL